MSYVRDVRRNTFRQREMPAGRETGRKGEALQAGHEVPRGGARLVLHEHLYATSTRRSIEPLYRVFDRSAVVAVLYGPDRVGPYTGPSVEQHPHHGHAHHDAHF